ncbi:MAG: nitroreductase family protein [Candidatus Omnitrophota bacterium]
MDVYRAILKRRSIRSFLQKKIHIKHLKRMVNAARLAPSAANLQPLEFLIITAENLCERVFKHLKWAGYIAPDGSPEPGCRPVAYIIIIVNSRKVSHPVLKRDESAIRYSFKVDQRDIGAAVENMLLFAESKGIASCWLGAINSIGIKKIFALPRDLIVDSVIAFGYPKMFSKVSRFDGSIKYYLDKKGVLHVPKRSLEGVMHINSIIYERSK